jgi:predicted DNA-binding WGR domain protein
MAYLTRTDPTRNIDRFYLIDITSTLFGEWAALREWGRRGTPGTMAAEQLRAARLPIAIAARFRSPPCRYV